MGSQWLAGAKAPDQIHRDAMDGILVIVLSPAAALRLIRVVR